MTLHAITLVGHDRPGIIAQATGLLGSLGLNLDDSTMTLLRGQFAMTLVCDGPATTEAIETALSPMTDALAVTVRELPEERPTAAAATSWVLSVHGGDKSGIVSSVVSRVADAGGNITDLTTHLKGGLYLLVAEVDLPADADVEALRTALGAVADELAVGVTLNPVEADEL